MALSSNCYHSEYRNQIFQNANNELLPSEILSSSNCEFILIRTPPCVVSFYSIPDEEIIYKWTLNDVDSNIWSLYPFDYNQQITITDNGCLDWSSINSSVLFNICSNTDEYLSSENGFMESDKHSNSNKLHVSSSNQSRLLKTGVIWIPILCSFIAALFVVLCCFLSKKFFDKKDMKKEIDFNDEQECIGTNNTKIYDNHQEFIAIDSFDVVDDLQVNLDNIEDDFETDDSENDNYIDSLNDNDKGFPFDLRGKHAVSQDITVINEILTPSNDQKFAFQNQQNIMI